MAWKTEWHQRSVLVCFFPRFLTVFFFVNKIYLNLTLLAFCKERIFHFALFESFHTRASKWYRHQLRSPDLTLSDPLSSPPKSALLRLRTVHDVSKSKRKYIWNVSVISNPRLSLTVLREKKKDLGFESNIKISGKQHESPSLNYQWHSKGRGYSSYWPLWHTRKIRVYHFKIKPCLMTQEDWKRRLKTNTHANLKLFLIF